MTSAALDNGKSKGAQSHRSKKRKLVPVGACAAVCSYAQSVNGCRSTQPTPRPKCILSIQQHQASQAWTAHPWSVKLQCTPHRLNHAFCICKAAQLKQLKAQEAPLRAAKRELDRKLELLQCRVVIARLCGQVAVLCDRASLKRLNRSPTPAAHESASCRTLALLVRCRWGSRC